MHTRLVHLDPMSVAKIYAALLATIGFIAGLLLAAALIFNSLMYASEGDIQGMVMLGLSVAAIVVLPLLYGLLGFIVGMLVSWLFNLVAKRIGGIGMTFMDEGAARASGTEEEYTT